MTRYLIVILALVCGACASSGEGQRATALTDTERYRIDAHTELALASLEKGNPEAARAEADRALSIADTSGALHAVALASLALDDTATARIYFQKALDAQGGNSDAVLLLNYGTFLCNERQTSEGLALLRRAAVAAPSEAGRVKRLSAACARSLNAVNKAAKRELSTQQTRELNGSRDE